MVVGGSQAWRDSEILDFYADANVTSCQKPTDLPTAMVGAVGAYIRGRPMICGGYEGGECYTYYFNNSTWIQQVKQYIVF